MSPLGGIAVAGIVLFAVGVPLGGWIAFGIVAAFELVIIPSYRAGVRIAQDQERAP